LVAVKEFEGGVEPISMLAGVVGEFYEREEVGPRFRINRTENGEVGFDFLVNSLGGSVSLGVEQG
jgi:hypothetical protein